MSKIISDTFLIIQNPFIFILKFTSIVRKKNSRFYKSILEVYPLISVLSNFKTKI